MMLPRSMPSSSFSLVSFALTAWRARWLRFQTAHDTASYRNLLGPGRSVEAVLVEEGLQLLHQLIGVRCTLVQHRRNPGVNNGDPTACQHGVRDGGVFAHVLELLHRAVGALCGRCFFGGGLFLWCCACLLLGRLWLVGGRVFVRRLVVALGALVRPHDNLGENTCVACRRRIL